MMLKVLFSYLYPFVGLISVIAYMPQIKSLIKAKASPVNISIKSWLLWILGAAISLGYGLFCLEDLMFILITTLSLFLMLFIITLIIYMRYVVYGECKNIFCALLEYFFKRPFFAVKIKEERS